MEDSGNPGASALGSTGSRGELVEPRPEVCGAFVPSEGAGVLFFCFLSQVLPRWEWIPVNKTESHQTLEKNPFLLIQET